MRPRPVSLLVSLCALAALPAAAQAALPAKHALIGAHQHGTNGHDWHVQIETGKDRATIKVLVLYAQECNEATEVTQNVPIAPDGSFSIERPVQDNTGTWKITGQVLDPGHATGTWSITRGACTIADRPYDAYSGTRGPNGAHFVLGNMFEYGPAGLLDNKAGKARKLRVIQLRSLLSRKRFSTPKKAARRGYVLSTETGCPGLHHARKHGTVMWGKVFDAKNPQSLVYWCDADWHWTLAGYMYRARGDRWPNTYGDMIQWHKHGGGPLSTWMTHVWMVNDPIASWATCAPFPAFEAKGLLTFTPYRVDAGSDRPCSDSYRTPEQQQAQASFGGSYGG